MTGRLAIFLPQLGTVSETFIRRHVQDLMPDQTVVVAQRSSHPMGGRWTPSCPVLFLDRWELQPSVRVLRRLGLLFVWARRRVIANYLRRYRVDVALGEYLDHFIDYVPVLDWLGIPYVVQGHGIDLSAALRRPGMAQRYAAYCGARAILTRCEFHRQRLIALGLPAEKVAVNPGGVDIVEQPIMRGADAGRRFLAIGRMTAKKGPIYLLEAFRRCAEQLPDVTLDCIGDGEMLTAVRQFVDASGLSARVRLHGAAADDVKDELLMSCGVFVQHSVTDPDTGDEEGLPASIQEAMAHGLAVVSTRHSGIAEAVEHGVSGFLVGEGDVADMADAMTRLAQGNDWRQFGVKGREKARSLYSWPAERARLLHHLAPGQASPSLVATAASLA